MAIGPQRSAFAAAPAARRSSAFRRATSSAISNGFAEIVVGAGFQPLDLVLPAAARGQHQNRQRAAARAHGADQIEPGQPRQPEVDDRRVDRIFSREVESFLAVAGGVDLKAFLDEARGDLPPQLRLVLDQEYAHGGSANAGLPALAAGPRSGSGPRPVA